MVALIDRLDAEYYRRPWPRDGEDRVVDRPGIRNRNFRDFRALERGVCPVGALGRGAYLW